MGRIAALELLERDKDTKLMPLLCDPDRDRDQLPYVDVGPGTHTHRLFRQLASDTPVPTRKVHLVEISPVLTAKMQEEVEILGLQSLVTIIAHDGRELDARFSQGSIGTLTLQHMGRWLYSEENEWYDKMGSLVSRDHGKLFISIAGPTPIVRMHASEREQL